MIIIVNWASFGPGDVDVKPLIGNVSVTYFLKRLLSSIDYCVLYKWVDENLFY